MDVADFDIYSSCLLCKLATLYRNAAEGDCKGHQLILDVCVGSVSCASVALLSRFLGWWGGSRGRGCSVSAASACLGLWDL